MQRRKNCLCVSDLYNFQHKRPPYIITHWLQEYEMYNEFLKTQQSVLIYYQEDREIIDHHQFAIYLVPSWYEDSNHSYNLRTRIIKIICVLLYGASSFSKITGQSKFKFF